MRVIRCQDQLKEGHRTLEAFYQTQGELSEDRRYLGAGAMLSIIKSLQEDPDPRVVFGLTSMRRLCLLAHDRWDSPWYVIVHALSSESIHVDYLLPENDAPWIGARVTGEACSVAEAVKLTKIGMTRSEGWAAGTPEEQAADPPSLGEPVFSPELQAEAVSRILTDDPVGPALWFRSLDDSKQTVVLHALSSFVREMHPTPGDIGSAFPTAPEKRKPSLAVAVITTDGTDTQTRAFYARSPAKRMESFGVLEAMLRAVERRLLQTSCSSGCRHWWRQGLPGNTG